MTDLQALEPHLRLLVELCRRGADTRVSAIDLRPVAANAEWQALLAVGVDHRLDGLLLATLARLVERSPEVAALFPSERLEPLRLLRRQALGWELEQARVLAWLEKHGVGAVVLKGCALRHQVYAEPAERPVADLDLLFRPEDLDRADACLRELGYLDPNTAAANAIYREHHFHTQLEHPGGFAIELHWGLTKPGPRAQMDPAEMIRNARPVTVGGRMLLAPAAEDMVLHLASQAGEASVRRLGRIVDVDRVVARAGDDFDWDRLTAAAGRAGLQNAVGLTIRLAEHLFGTPVPPAFMDGLGMSRLSRANLAALAPTRWVLNRRAYGFVAARVVMQFWLETTAAARADVLLKACGLRRDPMSPLWKPKDPARTPPERRLRNRLPTFMKVAGYQAAIWSKALTRIGGGQSGGFW